MAFTCPSGLQNACYGAFASGGGVSVTLQVSNSPDKRGCKAECNAEALARILLQKHRIKVEGTIEETLQKHYKVKLRAEELFIMPSFNDFLGGRPVNETRPRKELGTGSTNWTCLAFGSS